MARVPSTRKKNRDPKPPGLGPVLDFMRLLWALNHELESLSKRMDANFGVTGPQRFVLRIVGQLPSISAGRLARILHVHPSTLTGVLRRLVERQLVERIPDPSDGRRALFSLAPRGRAVDALSAGTVEAAISRTLRRFSPRKLSAAHELLAALADGLNSESSRRL
jgi:DNA-binding MarR family transcriptional regulator